MAHASADSARARSEDFLRRESPIHRTLTRPVNLAHARERPPSGCASSRDRRGPALALLVQCRRQHERRLTERNTTMSSQPLTKTLSILFLAATTAIAAGCSG